MTTLDPATLQPGETVSIEIVDATVAFEPRADGYIDLYLPDPAAGSGRRWVELPLARVTIHRETPADGVPQPGDLWKDRTGRRLFAHQDADDARKPVRLIDTDGEDVSWPWWHRGETGPISLDWRPEPPKPAEPEPVPSCRRCDVYLHQDSEGIWVDDAGYQKCGDDEYPHQPGGSPPAAADPQSDSVPDGGR